jgi:SAM-dependent methyltransferase
MAKRNSIMSSTPFAYNRVLKRADYALFNVANRKGWEVSMSLKTLRELGAAHSEAMILGVGAAKEPTIYHLSNEVKLVFATDLYLDMGAWSGWAGKDFLMNPAQYAGGVPCDPQRIIPQHMDMTNLHYPDNTFDGIFSSGSIEHVNTNGKPDYGAIAQAAREMGRVVKPGGIVSLSTEWKLQGDGWGWDNVVLFDEETLMKYIVEPSGCELVDEPDFSFDGDMVDAVTITQVVSGQVPFEYVLKEGQFVFTSVHIALVKKS